MTSLRHSRRALGALLVLFVLLPVHRLLERADTGTAGAVVHGWTDVHRSMLFAGMALLLVPAILCARLLPWARVQSVATRAAAVLDRPGAHPFALAVAALCAGLTLAFSFLALEARPNLIDSVVQLLHARFWAAGSFAGPILANEFWHIQNSLITERGWVSQYPPGHVLLLAAGFRIGAVWLVGPLMAACAVYFTARTAELLIPHERAAVRIGALLLAVSPFFIALSGSYMNHVTAAAFLAVAAFCAVRAAIGGAHWAILAGGAAAFAFATRPLATLAIGTAVVLGPWLAADVRRNLPRNILLAAAGALPLLLALAWYNTYFFGAPHRFGYDLALGPSTGLGFGIDPWGNRYGLAEAIGWTGADLVGLSLAWLESPVPLAVIAGLYLMFVDRLSVGERIIVAAPLLQLLANFFYWHHGSFMGPRMLHEAAPWWMMIGALAIVRLTRRAPEHGSGILRAYSPRSATAAFFAVGIVAGVALLAPQRLASYGGQWMSTMRMPVPHIDEPALVFVHDAWIARIAMDLASAGVRLDHVETLIRQNDTCDVAALASSIRATPNDAEAHFATLDLQPRAEPLAPFFSPGSRIRVTDGRALHGSCADQAFADRFGVYDIAPLLWIGDLPGAAPDGTLFVRDFGPDRNRVAKREFPGRTPFVLAATERGGAARLLDYESGMSMLWRDDNEVEQ